MKTIYTDYGRLIIPTKTISLVEEAAKEVYRLSRTHHWDPSIVIGIPDKQFIGWEPHYDGSKQNFCIDVGVYHPRVVKAVLGRREFGWRPLIPEDLRVLPESYFVDTFVAQLLHDRLPLTKRVIEMIEGSHWQNLASLLCKEAESQYYASLPPQWKGYYKRIMETSRELSQKGAGLEQLVKALRSAPR